MISLVETLWTFVCFMWQILSLSFAKGGGLYFWQGFESQSGKRMQPKDITSPLSGLPMAIQCRGMTEFTLKRLPTASCRALLKRLTYLGHFTTREQIPAPGGGPEFPTGLSTGTQAHLTQNFLKNNPVCLLSVSGLSVSKSCSPHVFNGNEKLYLPSQHCKGEQDHSCNVFIRGNGYEN